MNNTFSQLTKKICETKKEMDGKKVSSSKSKIQKERHFLIKIGKEIWFYPRLCFGVFKSIHAKLLRQNMSKTKIVKNILCRDWITNNPPCLNI